MSLALTNVDHPPRERSERRALTRHDYSRTSKRKSANNGPEGWGNRYRKNAMRRVNGIKFVLREKARVTAKWEVSQEQKYCPTRMRGYIIEAVFVSFPSRVFWITYTQRTRAHMHVSYILFEQRYVQK